MFRVFHFWIRKVLYEVYEAALFHISYVLYTHITKTQIFQITQSLLVVEVYNYKYTKLKNVYCSNWNSPGRLLNKEYMHEGPIQESYLFSTGQFCYLCCYSLQCCLPCWVLCHFLFTKASNVFCEKISGFRYCMSSIGVPLLSLPKILLFKLLATPHLNHKWKLMSYFWSYKKKRDVDPVTIMESPKM